EERSNLPAVDARGKPTTFARAARQVALTMDIVAACARTSRRPPGVSANPPLPIKICLQREVESKRNAEKSQKSRELARSRVRRQSCCSGGRGSATLTVQRARFTLWRRTR